MTSMNNFQLSDEQSMIQDTVRKFVADVASKNALEADEHRSFVRTSFDGLGELGMFGFILSEDSGGMDLGYVTLAVALEEVAAGCASTARLLLTQAGVCAKALDGLADAADALGPIAMGEKVACWVGPEYGITTDGSGALTGTADFATGATEADVFVVCAKNGDSFELCLADSAATEATLSLGFRATGPGKITFDGTASTVVATGDDAKAAIARAEIASLVGAAAIATGSVFASTKAAKAHAAERMAFGKPLMAQQAVGRKLIEAKRAGEAARHLTYHAARLADAGGNAREAAMQARWTAVEAAIAAADESIQILGGFGFTVEYHVERHYRDMMALETLDGGTAYIVDALRAAL